MRSTDLRLEAVDAPVANDIISWLPSVAVNKMRGYHVCPFCEGTFRSEISVDSRVLLIAAVMLDEVEELGAGAGVVAEGAEHG